MKGYHLHSSELREALILRADAVAIRIRKIAGLIIRRRIRVAIIDGLRGVPFDPAQNTVNQLIAGRRLRQRCIAIPIELRIVQTAWLSDRIARIFHDILGIQQQNIVADGFVAHHRPKVGGAADGIGSRRNRRAIVVFVKYDLGRPGPRELEHTSSCKMSWMTRSLCPLATPYQVDIVFI